MYNHNKAQQSKNRVHISWDILYQPKNNDLRQHDAHVMPQCRTLNSIAVYINMGSLIVA